MRCPNCQSENPDDSFFCAKCGTKIKSTEEMDVSQTRTIQTTERLITPGITLAGKYKIEEEIGRGGMGVVYKAEDIKLKRSVALKFLPSELTTHPEAKERFIREAQAAAALDHPHICTVYEVDEDEGKTFISMAYVEGESLKKRLAPELLPVHEALDTAIQVAEGLEAAHKKGIIHRDIKSANIMVDKQGQAKIMDFGLAKVVGASMITREPTTMGTVAYMSPEQARGETVDHRTDIWSLGVVLYEILSGQLPFMGEKDSSILYSIVHEEPKPIKYLRPDIAVEFERIISRTLKKDPEDRYLSATALLKDLRQYKAKLVAAEAGFFNLQSLLRRIRQPRIAIPSAIVILVLTLGAVWFFSRQAKIRWAREELLPQIVHLMEEGSLLGGTNFLPAYKLAQEAEKYISNNPKLKELFSQFSINIPIHTTPPGANVYMKEIKSPASEWIFLGVTPIEHIRVPIYYFQWKMEMQGYEPVLFLSPTFDWDSEENEFVPFDLSKTLDKMGTIPTGTVRVKGANGSEDFFIDKFEITNKQFKEFVNNGGYQKRKYWKHKFFKDGRELTWDEAMAEFVDQTARPGPATWRGGDFPVGQADHPVTGISWYEAAAFAEFVGKSLPTIHHWERAAGFDFLLFMFMNHYVIPLSNFGSEGPAPVGSSQGMTFFGVFDMAGNVREWCWNQSPEGRCLQGGAWNDASYMFHATTQAPAFNRSSRNGFRCVQYINSDNIPDALLQPVVPEEFRDFYKEEPVSDYVFQEYKSRFDYDPIELKPEIEMKEESEDWIKQKITYNAAYGNERMSAYLFLPKNATPPFQAVIYYPGSDSLLTPSSENIESYYEFTDNLEVIVKNGRAVLFPIYKGTFERSEGKEGFWWVAEESHQYTEYLIKWVKDLKRSLDYLETRQDIDNEKLAYYGFSWGGLLANIILAVEERFKVSILNLCGLMNLGWEPDMRARPEADSINYVTRVKIPTLMLNGKYDLHAFPYEKTVKPMYDLLGTPEGHKKSNLYETDHFIPKNELIKETLAWLDRYLGPVK